MFRLVDTAEAWEKLRASRARPPGRAESGKRRQTYRAAIEQAEQMFRAAERVGPATRPLQVFYGLSQAGRAIAAAAVDLKGEEWRLDSHGIKASGFEKPFPDLEVRTDPRESRGSFTRVSSVLDSPVWERTAVRLEDLWDLLPVNVDRPLTGRDRHPALYVEDRDLPDHDSALVTAPVCHIPDRVITDGSRQALADFFAAYPMLARCHSYVRKTAGAEGLPAFRRYQRGGGELTVNWQMPQGPATSAERSAHLAAITRPYRGARYFLPTIGGLDRELHPLMAWWAVLYALSMLARYEPAEWAAHINVDASTHAVPIEKILEHAIAHLPGLIVEAITDVAPTRTAA